MVLVAKKKLAVSDTDAETQTVAVRIPDDLWEAFQAFRKAQRIRPSKTDITILALQEFFQREGFYPPKR